MPSKKAKEGKEIIIAKLMEEMPKSLWKEPEKAIKLLLEKPSIYNDYKRLAHHITRGGKPLSKAEKKEYGINTLAKVGEGVFEYFTEDGLPLAVRLATELALNVSIIMIELMKEVEWSKN